MPRNYTADELFAMVDRLVVRAKCGESFDMKMADMPLATIEEFINYGARRSLQDHANSKTKDFDDAIKDSEKAKIASMYLADMVTGEWLISTRKTRDSVDDWTRHARKVIAGLLGKDARKKLAEMDGDARVAKLDELIAANRDAIAGVVDESIAEEKRRKESAVALGSKLSLTF